MIGRALAEYQGRQVGRPGLAVPWVARSGSVVWHAFAFPVPPVPDFGPHL
jgi:hypothetical protein